MPRKGSKLYKDSKKSRVLVNKRQRNRFLRTNTLLSIKAGQVRFQVTTWVAVEPKTWYGFETFDVLLVQQIERGAERHTKKEEIANFTQLGQARAFAVGQARKRTMLAFDAMAGEWFYSPVCVLVYSARTIVVKFWVSDRVELEQFGFFQGLEVSMMPELRERATDQTPDGEIVALFKGVFADHFQGDKEDFRVQVYRLENTLEPLTDYEPFRACG